MSGITGWTVERKLLVGTFIMSVLGFTFGLGVNYARLTQQEAVIQALQAFNKDDLPATYLRRDVYQADQQRLTDAINQLTHTLAEDHEESRKVREWLKATR